MLFRPRRHLTLSSFIPHRGNQHARAAGIRFVDAEKSLIDTLIVAGRPGSGKTHLLHALANFAKHNEAITSIACLSAMQFADEVMRGGYYGDLDVVLRRYASEGLLAIDDIERFFFLPEIATALLQVMQMRQVGKRRTLLTTTLCIASAPPHPLVEFLDHQPAVRLI